MTIRPVRLFGDPVLITRAEEVTEFDDTLKALVEDMLDTMDAFQGVGLAANQVGVLKRVFVYDCHGERGHVVNPEWVAVGDEKQVGQEGCLSIPEVYGDVERAMNVAVRGVDYDGNPVEFEASELLARCVQHETDHLDGVVFLKRLEGDARKQAMRELRSTEWFERGERSREFVPGQ